MNDTPLCSECGEEMEYSHSYNSGNDTHYEIEVYVCTKCGKMLEVK